MRTSLITRPRKTAVDLLSFSSTMSNNHKSDGNGNISEGCEEDETIPAALSPKSSPSLPRRRKWSSDNTPPPTSDEASSFDTSKEQEPHASKVKLEKASKPTTAECNSSPLQCNLVYTLLLIAAGAAVAAAVLMVVGQGNILAEESASIIAKSSNATKEGKEVLRKLQHLETQFPEQGSEFWNSLKAGIRDLFRDKKPLVSLLVYKPEDSELAHCLAYKMVKSVFENATSIQTSSLSHLEDYGSLIEQLQNELSTNKGVFLENLNKLPGHLALALHVVCDREDPLVRGTMVVMTLEVTNLDTKGALDSLTKIWEKHLNDDKLPALLTRVVSRVFPVKSQEELPAFCFL